MLIYLLVAALNNLTFIHVASDDLESSINISSAISLIYGKTLCASHFSFDASKPFGSPDDW